MVLSHTFMEQHLVLDYGARQTGMGHRVAPEQDIDSTTKDCKIGTVEGLAIDFSDLKRSL
jgi:hypothetical protein